MEHVEDPVEKEKAWEDLGRPADPSGKRFLFAYSVFVGIDGAIHTQLSEPTNEIVRKATSFDVYSTSRDLIQDIETQMLASRISQTVLDGLKTADPKQEARERLISALSNRGIETPNA
jgi:hypothetical protein